MSGLKTTSYLPAQELLAKYPGRLANISACMAACYIANGESVPDRLTSKSHSGYIKGTQEDNHDLQD